VASSVIAMWIVGAPAQAAPLRNAGASRNTGSSAAASDAAARRTTARTRIAAAECVRVVPDPGIERGTEFSGHGWGKRTDEMGRGVYEAEGNGGPEEDV
jgi:hypothetical protein